MKKLPDKNVLFPLRRCICCGELKHLGEFRRNDMSLDPECAKCRETLELTERKSLRKGR